MDLFRSSSVLRGVLPVLRVSKCVVGDAAS